MEKAKLMQMEIEEKRKLPFSVKENIKNRIFQDLVVAAIIMLVTGARILKKQYGRHVSVGTLRTVDCVMPHVLQRMISAAMPVETISTIGPVPTMCLCHTLG